MFTNLLLADSINEPVTQEEIEAAEATLDVTLPDDFLAFLKRSNGGYVNYNKRAFPVDFSIESGDIFIEVEEIKGLDAEGILQSEYLVEEWDLPQNLLLFSGSGHAWVGFNYDGRDIPNIVYAEPDEGDGNNFHVLADTFTEFVQKLDDPEKYIEE
ncbi:SMI1/KNR4 family protein [Sporosarcina sp. FSL K6-1522]|uniref:SMI1/KNR4 family protein n=1 Tax=Sporosarcina sp. FSL K6-1522 TaxID=2921554 RepID=UPI00315A2C39